MIRFSPGPNRAREIAWLEWGDEAFLTAARQDKPVLLFIGAFWCGVCHRMDETSFSTNEVIAMLNAYFVCVRVEESQRPDIDLRYNLNGWPTLVFLAPSGDLLFSTNALEPEPFLDLLLGIVASWQRDRGVGGFSNPPQADPPLVPPAHDQTAPLSPSIVAEIAGMVEGLADPEYGGFGTETKLFQPETTEFLLHLYAATGRQWYLDHVLLTLRTMRASRTYHSEEGGFFRYSSRRDWQEPHPEKLLDDQAALVCNYLDAYVLADAADLRETAESLIDYLNATLLDPATGAFFGCQDYVSAPSAPSAQRGEDARIQPVIDDCIYCDSNARAATAYLRAWWTLGRSDCADRAGGILDWLWTNVRAADGGLYHFWNGAPKVPGLLMDSVMAGRAMLDAYAVLGDATQLERASELGRYIIERHRSPDGSFADICEVGPAALRIPMTVLSQNAAVATFLARLADLGGKQAYRQAALLALQPFAGSQHRYGSFAAGFGLALSQVLSDTRVVELTGEPGSGELRHEARGALTGLRPRTPVIMFTTTARNRRPHRIGT